MGSPTTNVGGASRKCSHCGFTNRPGVDFCTSCGASVATTAIANCPNCGKVISTGIAFCGYCGKQLQGTTPTQQEVQLHPRPTKFCQHCRAQIDAEAEICPNCGNRENRGLAQYAAQSGAAPLGIDKAALRKIKIFAMLGIVGIVLAVIVPLLAGISIVNFFELGSINSGSIDSYIGNGIMREFLVSMMLGLLIGIVAIAQVRSAFVVLSRFDHRFSTPASLARLFYAGLVMPLISSILILGLASSTSSTLSVFIVYALISVIIFDVVGAICAIIGGIGVILGIWRVGGRYGEAIIKVASILYIVPFADVIAPILVYVGARGAERKLSVPEAH